MKKIMFIAISLFGGGAERVLTILSNALSERGWDVCVVVYQRKEREYELSKNVKLYEVSVCENANPVVKRLGYIRQIRAFIKKEKPFAVIPFLAAPVVHTYIANWGLNSKIIATVRNNPDLYPENKILRWAANFCTRHSDAIMFQTEEQKQYFPKAKNSFVIHNPVNPEMLHGKYIYKNKVKVISTFGRLSKQKNHQMLIRAFSLIAHEYPDIRLQIFGEGEEQKSLEGLISELQISSSAVLMGNTSKVKDELLNTDIFVLSSYYEGLPNALIEAMAEGVPCISTECPTGPKDLLAKGKNGLLVPCDNINELAIAMKMLIENQKLRSEIGLNAKEKIEAEYTVDSAVKSFERYVQNIGVS